MRSSNKARREMSAEWTPWRWRVALLLLVIATIAIRSPHFSNPFVHVDEEFYLLVGDRMLHGAIPYVDIWDRKPVGLFLLYAGIRMLGGNGFIQYQLVAALFAGLTAVVIALMARRISNQIAAVLAGLAYVLALAMSGGQGGQTPVFYNLLVALAAMQLLLLASEPAGPDVVRRRGLAAMALVGIALQIKYSPLFEGLFFGLLLLRLSWRASGGSLARLAADAALWIGAAIAPTLLAYAWYVAAGHGDAFLFANLWSISLRGASTLTTTTGELRKIAIRGAIFAIPILIAHASFDRDRAPWADLPDRRRAYRFRPFVAGGGDLRLRRVRDLFRPLFPAASGPPLRPAFVCLRRGGTSASCSLDGRCLRPPDGNGYRRSKKPMGGSGLRPVARGTDRPVLARTLPLRVLRRAGAIHADEQLPADAMGIPVPS